MIMGSDFFEGEGVHIYRSLSEIRRDIDEVSSMIAEINSMLNIRDMLMRLISEEASAAPSEWLPELLELSDGAREGLSELRELEKTLDALKEEMLYTRRALSEK